MLLVQTCSYKITLLIVEDSPHATQSQQAAQEHIPEELLSVELKLLA